MRFFGSLILLCYLPFCAPVLALTPSVPDISDQFLSVVQISFPDRDTDGSEVTAYCVGTFVSPEVLVTAAHCVRGSVLLGQQKIRIQSGYYKFRENSSKENEPLGYFPRHDETYDFEVKFAGDLESQINSRGWRSSIVVAQDLAILRINKPFPWPEGFQFPQVMKSFELKNLQLNNYQPTVVTINPLAEIQTLHFKKKGLLDQVEYSSRGYWKSQSVVRVEPGDSGAPFFVKSGTHWFLVGTTKGRGENLFSNWDVFVLLDKKACAASQAFSGKEISLLFCP